MRKGCLVVAVFTLTGCADDGTEPVTSTPPPAAEATAAAVTPAVPDTAASATGRVSGFVAVVRDKVPEVAAGRSDAEIQAVADAACADLAAGKDGDAIVDSTRALGTVDAEATDHVTARELIKLAIDTTCLDQARRVDEF